MSGAAEGCDPQLDEEITELQIVLSLVRLSAPVIALASAELADRLQRRGDQAGPAPRGEGSGSTRDDWGGATPASDPDALAALVARALVFEYRFRRGHEPADLDRTIDEWRCLVRSDQSVPWPMVAETTAHLGSLLRQRLGILVETADDDTIMAALQEAHRTLQSARAMLPTDSPHLAETCWLLGLSWGDRYACEQEPAHLDRAIAEITEALRLEPDPSGDRHYALAKALHERAVLLRDSGPGDVTAQVTADLAAALEQVRIALQIVDPADPLLKEVLWTAVTIAIAQREAAPAAADVTELQAWTDRLLQHSNAPAARRTPRPQPAYPPDARRGARTPAWRRRPPNNRW